MAYAIITKYLGPTNRKGARVRAWTAPAASNGRARAVIVPWQYDRGPSANHAYAARQLAIELGWGGEWVGNELPGPKVAYVYVRRGGSMFVVDEDEGLATKLGWFDEPPAGGGACNAYVRRVVSDEEGPATQPGNAPGRKYDIMSGDWIGNEEGPETQPGNAASDGQDEERARRADEKNGRGK
jgi:hypothetical protein